MNIDFEINNDNFVCTDNVIAFSDNIKKTVIIENIKKILSNDKISNTIRFNLKNLDVDLRINIMKYAFSNYDIENSYFILNIINFIKNYNSFSDDFFSNENIIVNSLEEFLDFKISLKNEIDEFITKLAIYYFSLFKSIHKIDMNFLDNSVDIPKCFTYIFTVFDFYTLSGIISKSNNFSFNDCVLVNNAYEIVSKLCYKNYQTTELLKEINLD